MPLLKTGITVGPAVALAMAISSAKADADADGVKAAQTAYIATVDSRDPAKLEALWAHDDTVVDYEPGSKAIAVGWDNVKKNLEAFPSIYAELKNTIVDGPYVQVKGDVGRAVSKTTVDVKTKDGATRSAEIFQTDIFEKRGGAWLLVSHAASRVPK